MTGVETGGILGVSSGFEGIVGTSGGLLWGPIETHRASWGF